MNPAEINAWLQEAKPGATIYLIGAGGCGMSGLGHLLLDLEFTLAGSDLVENEEVQRLRARGALIHAGHCANQIQAARPRLAVYSSAIPAHNAELSAAKEAGMAIVRRAALLAALVSRQRGICVAGMHGKTTTAAWLAYALEQLCQQPSYAIGAFVPQLDRPARFVRSAGSSDVGKCPSTGAFAPEPGAAYAALSEAGGFVAEADESDGTLRLFHPQHALVLNVDEEHLDYFQNFEMIARDFQQFARQTSGLLVFCADDLRLAELYSRQPRAVSYGFHPLANYRVEIECQNSTAADWTGPAPCRPGPAEPGLRLANVRLPPATVFNIWHQGRNLGSFHTGLLGEKSISNATGVVALLHQMGFAPADIAWAMASFRGAARRQQELHRDEHYRVFDDYGHHPTEIRATLKAMKNLGCRRLLVAFQPHRYSRTRHLLPEFAASFGAADKLWLTEIYAAHEPEIPGINSALLAGAIRAQGQPVECAASPEHLLASIKTAMQPGDLILFLGAGADITAAAHEFAAQLPGRSSPGARRLGPACAEASLPEPAALGGARARSEVVAHANATRRSLSGSPVFPDAIGASPDPCPTGESRYADLEKNLSRESVFRRDEAMAKRTTLRVGGCADVYVEPAGEADLAVVLRFCATGALPFVLLGRGSNLLIRDGGIRGVVICLAQPHFSRVEIVGETLRCGAGARLKAVAVEARRHGLTGLEFLAGIPGSVGGAMRMNAGAMGSWMFDVVERIRFMDHQGHVRECAAGEVNVEYRGCPLFKNHIALGAILKGQWADQKAIKQRMDQFNQKRWESQPSQPSAGCIFKNPKTIPAGKLIDELGLKGSRVGGAIVSEVHANFIVNDGTATARDVLHLIEIIQQRAQSARGIELETEVEILGEG